MGLLDSFGALARSIIGAIVMFVLAIISFYVMVFIVATGSAFAGYTVSGDFVALSAAVLSAGSIAVGASPLTAFAGGGATAERSREP